MAEALGIIASSVAVGQLASEVTGSIIKLKRYWDQVKDAPGEIRQLLLEIDSLKLILSHIEEDQDRIRLLDPSQQICLRQSLTLCKQGADELSGLVRELALKIDGKTGLRRKAGASKVVLKGDEVKRLRRRMKNAIRVLGLAYQCHTNAMIRLQPDIIVARISDMNSKSEALASGPQDASHTIPQVQDMNDVTREATSGTESYKFTNILYHIWISSPPSIRFLIGSLQYWSRYRSSQGRRTLEAGATYWCPPWLSNRALDARYLGATSGWKFHLQAYPVLPRNHNIFEFVRNGNIADLRRMLAESPSYVVAKESSGNTPLHFAIFYSQIEVCKLLLDVGADPSAQDNVGFTALHQACLRRPNAADDSVTIDLCRLLINAGVSGSEVLHGPRDRKGLYVNWCYGSPALFQFLQYQMYPPYHELPMSDRLGVLESIDLTQNEHAIDIFRMTLGGDSFSKEMLAATDSRGWTVLHYIGLAMNEANLKLRLYHYSGQAVGHLIDHKRCYSSSHGGWSALLRDVFSAGSSIHAEDDWGETPLCVLLSSASFLEQSMQNLCCILYSWIHELEASGINLQRYGELETTLGLKDKVNTTPRWRCRHRKFYMISFSFGNKVEDWTFWFSEPTDYLAGDFWAMIEKSSLHSDSHCALPGSWPEDIELSKSDNESDYCLTRLITTNSVFHKLLV